MNITTIPSQAATSKRRWTTALVAGLVLTSGCQQQDTDTPSQDKAAPAQYSDNRPNLKPPASGPALPDFGQIKDVKTKKRAFFDYLQPMIEQENQHLQQLRQHFTLLQQQLQQQGQLHPNDQQWLTQAARLYRADADSPSQQLQLLLAKVDQIPPALVKAQAANESAWGTSRFARQANNLFGQWCFSPGCGIAPLQRDADLDHEVQSFGSVAAALRSYFTNLNGNRSYASLRQIRRCLNSQQQPVTGRALAAGLTNYSARGGHYIEELQAMIRINKLEAWQSNWWGDTDSQHACFSLVQVEADLPDPVLVLAQTSEAASSATVSTAIESAALASASQAPLSNGLSATASAPSSSVNNSSTATLSIAQADRSVTEATVLPAAFTADQSTPAAASSLSPPSQPAPAMATPSETVSTAGQSLTQTEQMPEAAGD